MQRSLTSLIAPFDSKYSLTKSCVYTLVSSVSEKDGFVGVLVANLRFNVNNEKCDLVLQLAAFCSWPFFKNHPLRTSSTAEHKKTSLADKRRFWRQESHLGLHAREPCGDAERRILPYRLNIAPPIHYESRR